MGYTAAEAHVHADELGDTFSDDMVDRIDERLGHPERCPHGWPVDPAFEQAENRELAPLADLEPGTARRSCASPSTTASSCTGSTTRASCPGATVEVREAQPAAGQFKVAAQRRRARRSARRPPPGSTSVRR